MDPILMPISCNDNYIDIANNFCFSLSLCTKMLIDIDNNKCGPVIIWRSVSVHVCMYEE
jgi:hypothetical protein